MPLEQEEQLDHLEFFKDSMLDNVALNGSLIVLERKRNKMFFERIAFGEEEILIEILDLTAKPFAMDFKSLRECNGIRKILGENWDVNKIDNHYVLANNNDTRIMVIKK